METIRKEKDKKLHVIYGDTSLGLRGSGFHYIFSYQQGGLVSLKKEGKEWLYRIPTPTFWRATTDNDRANGFSFRSNMWLGADLFRKHIHSEVKINKQVIPLPIAPLNNAYSKDETAEEVSVSFTYLLNVVPETKVIIGYQVTGEGTIKVTFKYFGQVGLPELPVLGMRFMMPNLALGYEYEGLSGETYPDRKAGGVSGTYEISGLPVTPYLVPQDCGVHLETKWVKIIGRGDLTIESEHFPFAFSCLPYTSLELENATHQEELPPPRYTVLCILARVRGVGGINSWGADVEEDYHISGEKDVEFSFSIR